MKRILFLNIIILLFIRSNNFSQTHIASKFQFRTHTLKGLTIPYRLFVPENYDPSKKYPLVLALHGSGERGSDKD